MLKNNYLLILSMSMMLFSCNSKKSDQKYVVDVYQTSQAGDNLKLMTSDETNIAIAKGNKISLRLQPNKTYQK